MDSPFALLDAPGGGASLFEDLVDTLVPAPGDFDAVCHAVEARASAGFHVVAALDYELGYLFEPGAGQGSTTPPGRFWVFSRRTELDSAGLAAWLANQLGDPPAAATLVDFCPTLGYPDYAAAIDRIRAYIAAGDCYQVNYTFFFSGQCAGDPLALYARLRAAQPVTCGGMLATPELTVLSLSPELFIERQAGVVRARPMKGTAPRLDDPALDEAALKALSQSAKDRAENVMIVDLIRNDLGRIADPGSVCVDSLCDIEAYPSVYQMTSAVRATSDADLASVLRALFPCGSITGAPKVRAMQIIRELEREARGLYTGALGWIGRDGDFRFNVAIRTLMLDREGKARFGVGSGIVWDSRAEAEYRECLLKSRFITAADPGFLLIETLRLSAGLYPRLERHLQRLQASAEALAFAFDRARITGALQALAASRPRGEHRVRLALERKGAVELTAAELLPTPDGQKAVISPMPLRSDDPWLRHKTTERTTYDAELRRVTVDPAVFDAIFLNERSEVCEGSRSNVFIRQTPEGMLMTPPLTCGLLPGVLRRELLDRGEAVEAVLTLDDLRSAAEIYLGNALRGLIRVRLDA